MKRMTNKEAINWLISLTADIGKSEHHDLWHYEQALYEIKEMLEGNDTNVLSTDTISRQAAIDATWFEPSYTDPLNVLTEVRDRIKALPSVQPDHVADISKKVDGDCISRQAALKELAVYIHLIDKTMGKGTLTDDDCMEAAKSVLGEDEVPAVQPEIIWCKDCKYAKWDDERGDYICNGRAVWENHYCGYAKKKGEEHD